MVQLDLKLAGHCIETALRRSYNRILSDCLKENDLDTKKESQVRLIIKALESLDFGLLRSKWPELDGQSEIAVTIKENPEGSIQILIGGKTIDYP